MPVVIPDGYAQVTINWAGSYFASGGGATVLGFAFPALSIDLQALAIGVSQSVTEHLIPVISNEVRADTVTAVNDTLRAENGLNVPGAVDAETCVPNSAVLCSYSTAFRGPRGRGRSYWPGMAFESSTNGLGIMTGPQTTGLQGAIDDFFAEIESLSLDGVNQVILQHISDDPDAPDKTPPIDPPPEVTNRTVQSQLATQRRRLRR